MVVEDGVEIPLMLKQCMIYIPHREPDKQEMQEMQNDKSLLLHITQGGVTWEPHKYNEDNSWGFLSEVTKQEQEDEGDNSCNNTLAYYDPQDYEGTDEKQVIPIDIDLKLCALVLNDVDSKFSRALPKNIDYSKLVPYFAYQPIEIIQRTLENTTQLARATIQHPLQRHLKSRFHMLRKQQLNEVVAMDTYFSTLRSLEGYTCSQVFFGCTSQLLYVVGMRTEAEFPDAYGDFLRDYGIPHTLRRDNAKSQQNPEVLQLHRQNCVVDE